MICFCFGFIAGDVITGVASSLYKGTFNSSVMREGLWHKLGSILCVLACVSFQYFLSVLNVDLGFSIMDACCIYISVMEIGSIIENIGSLNPDLSEFLSKFFEKLKQRGE